MTKALLPDPGVTSNVEERIMEKILPSSTMNLPPTPKQVRAIAKLCQQQGITEPLEEKMANRREARDLIYALRGGKNKK